jgi:hypothetical protein
MPRSFVCDVLLLAEHLREHYKLDPRAVSLLRSINFEIDTKLDSIRKREAFSKYKAAPHGSNERETLRNEYLDLAHIHKDWRSPTENFFP